ncbi:phosphotransferase [Streptomyces chrestomyceticus]|uniref:Phosphotransferase n=1 Tax=Streptomyces chrestomyceticus TaxID=68185 RepID=A0ABU7X568_9ACTN
MYSPPPDPADAHRLADTHDKAAAALGATPHGPKVWGWHGRTLSRGAEHPEHGVCWLRLLAAPADQAGRKLWAGTADAARNVPHAVRRPVLHGLHDLSDGTYAYRAELTSYVSSPVCAPSPVLRRELVLPTPWWVSLRASLEQLAAVRTDRVAVRQEWADRSVPRFAGVSAPQITEWVTVHGDLHFANLTLDGPVMLDWEGWGIGPYGYDAALLYVYSLLAPATAERVRQAFADVLDSPQGQAALLIVATELLQSASRGDHPALVAPLRSLVSNVTGP